MIEDEMICPKFELTHLTGLRNGVASSALPQPRLGAGWTNHRNCGSRSCRAQACFRAQLIWLRCREGVCLSGSRTDRRRAGRRRRDKDVRPETVRAEFISSRPA